MAFQTVRINYTTASNLLTVIRVALAFSSLALITLNQDVGGPNIGDIYTTEVCIVFFAIYIILVGKFTVKSEYIAFLIVQIGVVCFFKSYIVKKL
ncbi:MAG: hypothetical protein PWR23_1331 [Peptostreptococcaceae bacterium]|nr:hypothetical protein [Peptostreptococcaceae bacterium]